MDNVKFLYFRPAGYGKGYTSSENIDLVFEICPRLSNYLREHSKCPPYMLCKILDEDNHYYYRFPLKRDKDDPKRILQFIRKVEQIGNEGNDDYLFKNIITNNGRFWTPGDLRNLITTRYDVPVFEDMWKIYRFFMELEDLLLCIWDD